VFEILQGVSILLALITNRRSPIRYHRDIFGLRTEKYNFLGRNSVSQTPWETFVPAAPFYFLKPQDASLQEEYRKGFAVPEIFPRTLLGPNSHRDDFAISFDYDTACERIRDMGDHSLSDAKLREKYSLADNRDWSLRESRKADLKGEKPVLCIYRPFDFRWMLYGSYAFDYHRPEINDHLLKQNLALISTRQTKESFSVFVTKKPAGQHKLATPYDGSYLSPLFLYEAGAQLNITRGRSANLNGRFLEALAAALGTEGAGVSRAASLVTPENIFGYGYAVFHSPGYRTRYAEFLKTDFPRLPLTNNPELFQILARIGSDLVCLHLMESPKLETYITSFSGGRNPEIGKISYARNTVWIDKSQTVGFKNVPADVWNFHIGGYQVCEKWLKDRKGRTLSKDDIEHYHRIVVALNETMRLMAEIDKVIEAHGGWPGAFVTSSNKDQG